MEFIGIIKQIGKLETVTTQSGQDFFRRSLTLTTIEQYPQQATFSLRGDLAQTFAADIGQQAHVYFNFRGNISADDRPFNTLLAWRVDL